MPFGIQLIFFICAVIVCPCWNLVGSGPEQGKICWKICLGDATQSRSVNLDLHFEKAEFLLEEHGSVKTLALV